jgi:hypothetical protein
MWSVCRRRRLVSTAARRLASSKFWAPPRTQCSAGLGPAALVASTTWPRLPVFFSQEPMKRSVEPCVSARGITGYISAVSMKLMPRSSA